MYFNANGALVGSGAGQADDERISLYAGGLVAGELANRADGAQESFLFGGGGRLGRSRAGAAVNSCQQKN